MRRLDLVVLVPDADWRETIRTLLERRTHALGIRPLSHQIVRHPRRDPGVRVEAAPLLRRFVGRADFALVCADLEGSGYAGPAEDLADAIERALAPDWGDRCAAVVADPELEAWVWTGSPHVATALGWTGKSGLRAHMNQSGLWPAGERKPPRPKEAMEAVLALTRRPRSPAIYGEIASRVTLQRCADPSFARLRSTLHGWFPPG